MKQSLIELFGSVSRPIVVSFSLVGTLNLAGTAQALDIPTCAAGEYLWLVTAGNPSGTLMPNADMRVETVTFQDWSDGTKTLRTAQFTNVPKGTLGEAKTFERYSGGGNLGWFAQSWPVPIEGYAVENFKALPASNPAPTAAGGEYPSDFTSSRLIDGASGQTLAQVVSSPSFDGRLTYVAPSDARIDFVTIALCTTALPVVKAPTPTPTPPPTTTTPTPTPKIKPAVEAIDPAAPLAELDIIKAITAAAQSVKDASAQSKAAQQSAAAAAKTTAVRAESDRAAANKAADLAAKALKAAKEAAADAAAAITVTAAQDAAREAAEQAERAADQAAIASLAAENAADIEAAASTTGIEEPEPTITDEPITNEPITNEDAAIALAEREEAEQAAILAKIKAREAFDAAKKAQVKRDMITSGAIAASAVLNVVGNALAGMVRGGAAAAPTPAPSPMPAPAPTPTPTPAPSHAGGGGTGRGRTKGEKGKKNDSAQGKLTQSQQGVLFPSSTSFTGDIPEASPELQRAFDAVGRIGYARTDEEGREPYQICFGSAVLIAPDKILTNIHVRNIIRDMDYLGIEFEAREGSMASEFIEFADRDGQEIEGHDAVVLRLKTPSARTPIAPVDAEYDPNHEATSLGREIYCVGYPAVMFARPNLPMRLAMEEIFGTTTPVFNVKRSTTGQIIQHSFDPNQDILYDVPIDDDISTNSQTAALCHDAATMGGNSGGAVLCAATGEWLGLHFGGQEFDGDSVNYAVPGRFLRSGLAALGLEAFKHNSAANNATENNDDNGQTPLPFTPPLDVSDDDTPIVEDPVIEEPIIEEPVLSEPVLDEPVIQTPDPVNVPDDLTRIEGIGPKTAAALHAGGVRSFKAIAQRSPYDLLPILAAGGLKRRDPTTWPAQAALAAIGDWETLEDWQDKLHGGREPKQDS